MGRRRRRAGTRRREGPAGARARVAEWGQRPRREGARRLERRDGREGERASGDEEEEENQSGGGEGRETCKGGRRVEWREAFVSGSAWVDCSSSKTTNLFLLRPSSSPARWLGWLGDADMVVVGVV